MQHYDILIVGGGAAGISAAKVIKDRKVLLAERKDRLGGILLQCFHQGFGGEMTGPEYTAGLLSDFPGNTDIRLSTTVLEIKGNTATLAGKEEGIYQITFSELILATGCMERAIGHHDITGTRPKGIYTAGQAQEMINLHGIIPEGPVVILGSGDIGLVVATHLLERGIKVSMVEINPSFGGLVRNRKRMMQYPVDLHFSVTVKEVVGEKNIEGVILTDNTFIPAKSLLIATGLIPDRELLNNTELNDHIHICGNCNTVHPMVEAVVKEGISAGLAAFENTRFS